MAGKLYFDPQRLGGFSTFKRLRATARGKTAWELRAWLQAQDAYTLHCFIRKRIPRNPYTVNIMGFSTDSFDVQGLSKHNDGTKY